MRKSIIYLCFLINSQLLFSQSHLVQDHLVELTGNASNTDFSNNTYYFAYDSCDVSWQVIRDSIPDGWEFSFCFPNCYEPGVNSGSKLFLNNTEQYLNCHIYPNNVPGQGIIEMEIITNGIYRDTVVWRGTAINNLSLNGLIHNSPQKILKIYNIEGKILAQPLKNQILFIEYENGIVEKRIFIK